MSVAVLVVDVPVVSVLEVGSSEVLVVERTELQVLEVGISGPQGTQGTPGAQGPQGSDGTPGGSYSHDQAVPATVWTIVHNLGFRPAVFVEDTLGRDCEGEVAHPDVNTTVITFSAAFSGSAYLS